MPQSLVKNYIHITFSTKNRASLISEDIQEELFRYIGGTSRELGSPSLIVGGVDDHVHILVNLSRKMPLMLLVEKLKTHSSKWIKTKGAEFVEFYWQHGYGAFSVNPKQVEDVVRYIQKQKEHHRKLDYKKEFVRFLKNYDMPYDERYIWD